MAPENCNIWLWACCRHNRSLEHLGVFKEYLGSLDFHSCLCNYFRICGLRRQKEKTSNVASLTILNLVWRRSNHGFSVINLTALRPTKNQIVPSWCLTAPHLRQCMYSLCNNLWTGFQTWEQPTTFLSANTNPLVLLFSRLSRSYSPFLCPIAKIFILSSIGKNFV